MAKSAQIDLVKGKSTMTDELMKWALSFGRLLIIVVEIVAFSAFIYRFVLDRQIIDLNDKIKMEQAIIESSKEQENTFRDLQERLSTVKKITTNGNSAPKMTKDIVSNTPPEISYNSINVNKEKIDMVINISTYPALTTYIKNLKENPNIASVNITGIDNSSGGNLITVTLTAKFKGGSQ